MLGEQLSNRDFTRLGARPARLFAVWQAQHTPQTGGVLALTAILPRPAGRVHRPLPGTLPFAGAAQHNATGTVGTYPRTYPSAPVLRLAWRARWNH